MENLTNEQIIDIINFYKMCGITEDMYLSRSGVLDLFTLLGISPEYDNQGNRLPTVYEQLSIAPIFRDGKEIPIVFAIKHKVNKIHKIDTLSNPKIGKNFKYIADKEISNDKEVLINLKKEYITAFANGNLNEATRIYDMIDMLTGGKADEFVGIQFNAIKFYKKMQRQLLIDMFANFVILMILSKHSTVKEGILKFDKLYKSFVEHQLSSSSFGNFGGVGAVSMPKISNISISVSGEQEPKKISVTATAKKKGLEESIQVQQQIVPEQTQDNFISIIKNKVNLKINKVKEKLDKTLEERKQHQVETEKCKKSARQERILNILEND